jgi:hypothetical protein
MSRSRSRSRVLPLLFVAALATACASVPGRPSVAQVQSQPGRFTDRSVRVTGTVTTSFGVPFVGMQMYRVEDGTGELLVLSNNGRVPGRGARVEVKGRVSEFATFGGRSIGLHLREQSLRYRN